jgi:hypothetical protein
MARPGSSMRNGLTILLVVTAFFLGCVITYAAQPHMQSALKALRTARHELEIATPNKGGHRERAIELIDKAIGQVEEGIAYAR